MKYIYIYIVCGGVSAGTNNWRAFSQLTRN